MGRPERRPHVFSYDFGGDEIAVRAFRRLDIYRARGVHAGELSRRCEDRNDGHCLAPNRLDYGQESTGLGSNPKRTRGESFAGR